jgi:hypothetical protein
VAFMQDKIRAILKDHPHYGATRLAKHLETTSQSVRVICQRHRIFLMNREELEDMLDQMQPKRKRRGKA